MRTHSGGSNGSIEMFVVRIGNAEREAVIDRLTEHHVEGRLDVDEFDRRQRAALGASTQAELNALLADLPGPLPSTALRVPRRRSPSGMRRSPFRWVVPPAAVGGATWWFTNMHSNAAEAFATGLVCGAAGIVGTWWASRPARK